MKTELKVIDYILFDLSKKEKPLKDCIFNAQNYFSTTIDDHEDIIRHFLVEKHLINHNPRLRVINIKTEIGNGIRKEQDMLHNEFLDDHLTEYGLQFIAKFSHSNSQISINTMFE